MQWFSDEHKSNVSSSSETIDTDVPWRHCWAPQLRQTCWLLGLESSEAKDELQPRGRVLKASSTELPLVFRRPQEGPAARKVVTCEDIVHP